MTPRSLIKPACLRFAHALFQLSLTSTLLLGSGCKPSAPAGTSQATPRQPTARDLEAFVQGLLPATVKVSEIKMDAPTPLPDSIPGSNAWLLSVKITLTPLEDLFALPPTEDTAPLDQAVAELNRLMDWRNTYVQTPFAKVCGPLEIKVLASPLPQLLVVVQPRNQPMAPSYGKLSAEWQVDRWRFAPVDMTMPKFGDLRSYFQGATMVKGSPEAEKTLHGLRETITQARKDIAAIQARYAAQVAGSSKPGTLYTGTVSFRQQAAPCELRFLAPPSAADARFVSLEVRLPGENPPCTFTYQAKVSTELPLPVPGAQPPPASTSPVFDWNTSNQVPTSNVSPRFARSSGNKTGGQSLPATIASAGHFTSDGGSLLLLDGHLVGTLTPYFDDGIRLSTQQQTQP